MEKNTFPDPFGTLGRALDVYDAVLLYIYIYEITAVL